MAGSGSRCGRANVRREIRDGEVDFVPDGTHRGDGAGRESPRDDLLVEGPQIFQAAATARDDEHVDRRSRAAPRDPSRDLLRGAVSLHPRGDDEDRQIGKTAVQHAQKIVDGGAGGARDHRDAPGEERQGPLARGIEEPLGLEARLELLERDLQRARPERLEGIADELVLALRLVEGHPSPDEHREAVLHGEAEPPGLAREQHGADARVGVLEREVEVAAGRPAEVGDLAAHVQRREPALEEPFCYKVVPRSCTCSIAESF